MTALENPNTQQLFLLCLLLLRDLSTCYPVMENVVFSLVQIATRRRLMDKAVARHIYERLRNKAAWTSIGSNNSSAGFVVDLTPEIRGSDSATISELANAFGDMVVNEPRTPS